MADIQTGTGPRSHGSFRTLMAVVGALLITLSMLGSPATAQNLFAPVKKINDRVITAYELSQRIAFLTILKAPGNIQELALEQLTNEALQRQAAEIAEIELTAEDVQTGMEEFAGRFNLDVARFNQIIAQAGVAPETFRDFVSGGLAWRQVVRTRWAGRVNVTEDEVQRQLSLTRPGAGVRVLLSEIILPARNPAEAQTANVRASEFSQINTIGAFANAARQYSVAPSRGRSGRMNWIDLSDLPPAVAANVLPLEPGSVTQPIPVRNGVAVFQLRAIEEVDTPQAKDVTIDYATLLLPGGRSGAALAEAAKIRAKADTCDDLYGILPGLPEDQLKRVSQPISDVPAAYAVELAKLDVGEVSTALTTPQGGNLVFLMLCSRNRDLPEEVSLEDLKLRMQNQRLQSFANAYLEELRAAAYIEDYTNQ
ncbi:peptidylprolyl isomerase [Aliiroseovarius sp. 2305UL8-7]|uniref:peptidylprolyl isomerase n=1 Tax=Aliiroseovarius conchicola TaxID=3121637 RepID=UPI0035271E4F